MASFFEQTWVLWWIAAIIIVLRWFHEVSSGPQAKEVQPAMDRWEAPNNSSSDSNTVTESPERANAA